MAQTSVDASTGTSRSGLSGMIAGASSLVQTIATPSLTQLALRFALAVPFWRSGVNKWTVSSS